METTMTSAQAIKALRSHRGRVYVDWHQGEDIRLVHAYKGDVIDGLRAYNGKWDVTIDGGDMLIASNIYD